MEGTKTKKEGLFVVKTANDWIEEVKNVPVPNMLFSEFWHEKEICFLFADTNLGKSILAVQIADSISKGVPVDGMKLEASKQKVLYFDFELNAKQFELRYSQIDAVSKLSCNHYQFDDNFKRIEINSDFVYGKSTSYSEYLNKCIESCVVETAARVLIIDNLTYLKDEMENSKNAHPLMAHLKLLKSKYDLSILILGHTPKRDLSKPITKNDLSGSKMLMNFADSSFAVGESTLDSSIRYLKQIKARNTEIVYDTNNVALCSIEKKDNFLKFTIEGVGSESEHLKDFQKEDKDLLYDEVRTLKSQGKSNVEIAKHYNVSEGAVRKWLKKTA